MFRSIRFIPRFSSFRKLIVHTIMAATFCQAAQAQESNRPQIAQQPNSSKSPSPVAPSEHKDGQASTVLAPGMDNLSFVTGKVKQFGGNQMISEAQIVLSKVGEEHKRYATESASDGSFSFNKIVPGEWELTVSAPNMLSQSQKLVLQPNQITTIEVALDEKEAADILRISGKRTLIHPEKIGSTTHLDKQIIEQYGSGNDLRKLIQTTPGVVTNSFGNIITRGEHDAVNYVLDDVVLPEAAGVLQQGQFATPRSLQSIDVNIGGYEASDGGGPLGAVAKMRSIPIQSKPILEVGTQLGGPLAGGTNFYASTALSQNPKSWLNRVKVESSGMFFGTTLGIQPPSSHFRRDGRFDINVLNKVEFKATERDLFKLTAGINETFLHIPTPVASNAAGYKVNQHDRQNFIILSYKHKFSKWLDEGNLHIINAFYSQRVNSTNVFDPYPIINGDGYVRSASPTARRYDYSLGIQGDISKTVFGSHHLLAGFLTEIRPVKTKFQEWVYNADPRGPLYSSAPYGALISPFTGTTTGPMFQGNLGRFHGFRYLQSAYLQDKWTPQKGVLRRLTLDAGVRFDLYHGVFGNTMGLAQVLNTIPGVAGTFTTQPFQRQTVTNAQASGRFGGSIVLTKNTVLRGSFSNLFVPPPVDLFIAPIDVTVPPNNGIYAGTPKPLQAMRGELVDVSLEQQVGPRFVTRTNLFYKKLKNFGDSGVIDNTTVYNRLQLDGQEAYGVETRVDLKPTRDGYGLNGYISNTVAVAYLRGTKNDTGGVYVSPAPVYAKFPDHDRRESLQAALGYKTHSNFWILGTVSAWSGLLDNRDPAIFGAHPARTQPITLIGLNFGYELPKKYKGNRLMPKSIDLRIENLANQVRPENLGSPYQGTRYTLPLRVLAGCNWQLI